MFDGGELRLVLLHLIAEAPRHGYELIKAIEDRTGGTYAPSPGAIYPTLTLLRETGLVDEGDSGGSRKLYTITDAGRAHLTEHQAVVTAVMDRLGRLGEQRDRTDAAPVRRAMHSLKSALFEKLTNSADRETALAVAAILDDAAQKIERLP